MIRHLPGIEGTSIGPRDVESLGREDLTTAREIAAYEWLYALLEREGESSPYLLLGVFENVLTTHKEYVDNTPAARLQKMRGHLAAFNDHRERVR